MYITHACVFSIACKDGKYQLLYVFGNPAVESQSVSHSSPSVTHSSGTTTWIITWCSQTPLQLPVMSNEIMYSP